MNLTDNLANGSDVYQVMNEMSKNKRAKNRLSSTNFLVSRYIQFTSHNNGAHLIITHKSNTINFWPGTGKWNHVGFRRGYGVRNLIKYLKGL